MNDIKRITKALIERITNHDMLVRMFNILTGDLQDMLICSRDLYNTMESSKYISLSIRAELLLEKLQALDVDPREEGSCRYTECNLGDYLA